MHPHPKRLGRRPAYTQTYSLIASYPFQSQYAPDLPRPFSFSVPHNTSQENAPLYKHDLLSDLHLLPHEIHLFQNIFPCFRPRFLNLYLLYIYALPLYFSAIACIFSHFCSMSHTSLNCVRARSRLCVGYAVLKYVSPDR